MNEVKAPTPYLRQRAIFPLSPWSLKCDAIDEAVALITDPDAFTQAVAEEKQLVEGGSVCLEKPKSRFFEDEGGCPAFVGILNAGSPANVICKLTPVQLHGYVEEKLCHFNRNYYCPIWKVRGGEVEEGGRCKNGKKIATQGGSQAGGVRGLPNLRGD